jgi:hypothetical protein
MRAMKFLLLLLAGIVGLTGTPAAQSTEAPVDFARARQLLERQRGG